MESNVHRQADANLQEVVAVSKAVASTPRLAAFLNARVVRKPGTRSGAVLAWGQKPSARHAEKVAARAGLPVWWLEDGFLRSVELGDTDPPCSLVVDPVGIYYDATRPSYLEQLIPTVLHAEETARAEALILAWRAARVSKYNHTREYQGTLPEHFVLVVDQTLGDASIRCGMASASTFSSMLEAARRNHPDCTVVVKVHPDVYAGRKRGHFDMAALRAMPGVDVLAEDCHPVGVLEKSEAVYTVTSQMGFEALLWGKPVYTFGMPFYAGWGLTTDALVAPERRSAVSLLQLVHAALIRYPRYVHPEQGVASDVEAIIAWLGLQRRQRERFPSLVYAVGYSFLKYASLRDFFQGSVLNTVRHWDDVSSGATVAVWGRAEVPSADFTVVRLEDGFIRSVGLGAELVRPLSWVQDTRGIYYDPQQPSDLEWYLEHQTLTDDDLARAVNLRQLLVSHALTKYNLTSHSAWQRPPLRRVILVPGQVESDASIRYGAFEVRTNLGLLKAVRQTNPDAYVVYKPHPDVVAGMRMQGADESGVAQFCDEVIPHANMAQLLEEVDEVHTITSLTGFEALLRGKPVTCYGMPFYAGWGLTLDITTSARRSRKRSLDELVALALIYYPTYVSRRTGRFTTPEGAIDELLHWRRIESQVGVRIWRQIRRRVLQVVRLLSSRTP